MKKEKSRQEKRLEKLEELKELKAAQKDAKIKLNNELIKKGFNICPQQTPINRVSPYETVKEENEASQKAVENFVKTINRLLPGILKRLSEVHDYRNPKKVRHKVDVILLYGILCFVLQKTSRRQANREMTTATVIENLRIFFPALDSLPHQDTLNRFLSKVDISELESVQIELIKDFIKNKKFNNYLIRNCYTIAIDGTQKYTYNFLWAKECQQREISNKMQYHCSTLEAAMVFHNGIVIPLATEFLDYMAGDDTSEKQDCETKAFKRLAKRIRDYFPRLKIMVLLDGLYPSGPLMETCNKYDFDFMIVLPDESLPTMWEEFEALKNLETNNRKNQKWGNRRQKFIWVNDIAYYYGPNEKKELTVHMVICDEDWEEIAPNSASRITKTSKHVWLSNKPLNSRNVHERCNLGARHRWGIESSFLVEKQYGYQYEHTFSFNWNAMKGYHLLMHIAHMINVVAEHGSLLRYLFQELGMMAAIKFLDEAFRKVLLNREKILECLTQNYQVRFT